MATVGNISAGNGAGRNGYEGLQLQARERLNSEVRAHRRAPGPTWGELGALYGVSGGYLHNVAHGARGASPKLLRAMGLRRVARPDHKAGDVRVRIRRSAASAVVAALEASADPGVIEFRERLRREAESGSTRQ